MTAEEGTPQKGECWGWDDGGGGPRDSGRGDWTGTVQQVVWTEDAQLGG